MNIAICDDEKKFREQLKSHFELINDHDNLISEFCCGEDLIAAYTSEGIFDVIFIDIAMNELDGMSTAKIIRQKDNNVIIIFLTSHDQFVFESFKISAFDYIIKPLTIQTFIPLYTRIMDKYTRRHHLLRIKRQNEITCLEINDIIYLECYNRHVTFYTVDDKYECCGTINEYDETLRPYGFLRCHQGFLINMKYIKCIEKMQIITTTDKAVPISVRKRGLCLDLYSHYLTKFII